MPPNRERTLEKLKKACNQAVGNWKKAYKTSVRHNNPMPNPLSIAQIARVAGINPKTIHVNPDFKEVVLYAIAQTRKMLGLLADPDLLKRVYSKEEIESLIQIERKKSTLELEETLKRLVEAEKKVADLQKTIIVLDNNLRAILQENAKLCFENEQLKMRIKLVEGAKV